MSRGDDVALRRVFVSAGAILAALAGISLLRRITSSASLKPEPAPPAPEPPRFTPPSDQGRPSPPYPVKPPPAGYRYAMNLPPGAHAAATAMLAEPYGTTRTISAGTKTYLARVEPHYDKGQTGVDHWHKGVSLFEPVRVA